MKDSIAELCKLITHGVYIVGVSDGKKENAFTAAWVMQASFDPVLLVFSINPEHYSYQLLRDGGICSINVLSREQMPIADHFGQPGIKDKMAGFQWRKAVTGAPILADSLVYFDCEVSHYSYAGDHELAICRVVSAAALNQGSPMSYSDTGDMDSSSEIYPDEL